MALKKFLLAAGVTALSALGCVANTPMTSAEIKDDSPVSSEQVTILSPGESFNISNNQSWESIITEVPQGQSERPTLTTYSNDLAPTCINAVNEWGFVQVYNNCGFDIRVKVVLAFGPDSACHIVVDGTRHNIAPALGRIDRVEMR